MIHGKICMDILSDYGSYFKNIDALQVKSKDKTGPVGWSSAYTVQTLLLQLQGLVPPK